MMLGVMATSEMCTVDVPGGYLAYLDEGTGPPVVLLHGGVLDHRMWQPQVGPLIRAGYRVIAPDLRGHGRSSTPTAPFRLCDDVATLVRTLGSGPAMLVGISMGAGTATDVALEHPDVVDGVVISGAGTGAPDFRDPWVLELLERWARAERDRDAESWLDTFYRLGAGPHQDVADVAPAVMDLVRTMAVDTLNTHVPDGPPIRPTPTDRPLERVASLTIPLRAVVGLLDSEDHIRMPREVAEAVGGDVVEIPAAAHYPNLESPEAFTAAVLEFLRR